MIETITIARPYAKAVFGAAKEGDSLESWASFLKLLSTLMEHPNVQALLTNSQMNNDRIQSFLDGLLSDILKDQYTVEQRNFLAVLADNGRFGVICDIYQEYLLHQDGYLGIRNAKIDSALPLDERSLAGLVQALEKHYDCKIRPEVKLDAALIGGVRITVGDQVIDASVREQIDSMAAALTQ